MSTENCSVRCAVMLRAAQCTGGRKVFATASEWVTIGRCLAEFPWVIINYCVEEVIYIMLCQDNAEKMRAITCCDG